MEKIYVTYTIIDTIEIPDDATDNEINEICEQNWQTKLDNRANWNDMEWDYAG